jgi:hypothetical protein
MDPNATTGGAAQNTPAQGGDDSKPDYVTKEEMGGIINAAITSHLKRALPKTITEALGPALETALAPLREKLDKPAAPQDPADKGKDQPDPEVVSLKKKLEDALASMKVAQDAAETEKRKSDEQALRGAFRTEIAGKVRPEAVEDVVDLCFFRNLIKRDDQGRPTFTWRSALSKGMPEEDHQFPLADGVREFLKSKPAEIYLPPPSGDKGSPKSSAGRLPNGSTLPPTTHYDKPAQSEDEKLRRATEKIAALEARGIDIP